MRLTSSISACCFIITCILSCRPKLDKLIYIQRQKMMYGSMTMGVVRELWLPMGVSKQNIPHFAALADSAFITKNKTPRYSILFPKGMKPDLNCQRLTNDTTFVIHRPVLLEECKIKIRGDFIDRPFSTIFTRPIFFSRCRFQKAGLFGQCVLTDMRFDSLVIFTENTYEAPVRFLGDTFHNPLIFYNVMALKNSPEFVNSSFDKGVSFTNSELPSGELPYSKGGAFFEKSLSFSWCALKGKLDLSNCHFDKNATLEFKESFLPDTLDMSNTGLRKLVDLTEAFPNINLHKCEINLLNTDISLIKMQYRNFHLYFPDSVAADPFSKDIVSRTYEALLNNFKSNSFTDSYEQLDKEYKLWQSRYNWSLKISYLWWQFGYEKWYVIIWTTILLILFSFFNYKKYRKLQTVYPIEKLEWDQIQFSPNPFVYVFKKYFATLLYTGLIFFRLSIDFKNINFRPMRYVAVLIFQYSIGLVCTGFLLNWILKG